MTLCLVASALLGVATTYAQSVGDLRLSIVRTIVGTILDIEGEPIAGASIDNDDLVAIGPSTDSAGGFRIETRAPAFVVRKLGYKSQLIGAQSETEFRVTLQPAGLEPAFWEVSGATTLRNRRGVVLLSNG